MKTSLLVTLIVAFVVIVSGLWFYGYINSVRNEGISVEQQISKQYESNQNDLSAFTSSIYEQVGIANLKSDKMDEILKNAVQGRYGQDGFKANGAFFAAVKEAYPNIDGLKVYDRILEQVSAGRESFKGKQDKLLDLLRAYDTWLQQGLLQHVVINTLGFPTSNLKARVGGQTVATGQAALDKFHQIVLSSSTVEAFTTGKMEPMSFNTEKKAPVTKAPTSKK